jgi:Helix-turn-helix domain
MEPKWTPQETAVFLRLSEQTLANWRWRGCGPPYEKLNGAVRYDPQAVRGWAANQTQTSTAGTQRHGKSAT